MASSSPHQKYYAVQKQNLEGGGFLHNLNILKMGILNAVIAGRTLILQPQFLDRRHTAYIPCSRQIYDYLSLNEIQVYRGKKRQPFSYIKLNELDRKEAAHWTTQYVDPLENLNTDNSANLLITCLLYTSPSPRDRQKSRMPSSA